MAFDRKGLPAAETLHELLDRHRIDLHGGPSRAGNTGKQQSDEMLLHVWKAREARFARCGDAVLRVDTNTFRIWPKPVEVRGKNSTWA
jgi:hypothetical protein